RCRAARATQLGERASGAGASPARPDSRVPRSVVRRAGLRRGADPRRAPRDDSPRRRLLARTGGNRSPPRTRRGHAALRDSQTAVGERRPRASRAARGVVTMSSAAGREELLRQVPLFRDLSGEQLRTLIDQTRPHMAAKGAVIIAEGDQEPRFLVFLISGR